MRKMLLCTFLILLFFLYSCFNYRDYPDEWVPLQSPISECIDISGSYYDLPKSGTYESLEYAHGLSLAELFQVPFEEISDGLEVVRATIQIELISNKKIRIIARQGDTLINERLLDRSNGDFDCTSGMIKISGPSGAEGGAEGGAGAFAYGWANYYLSKNNDGALILKEVSSGFGTCCIGIAPIPFAGGQTFWSIYEPVVNIRIDP